jgi:hypothetical protein
MPRVVAWLMHEIVAMLPAASFFGIGFVVIVLTTNLVLEDYALRFGNFLLAVTTALIVGKAVLVANATPFLRRYDTMPLAVTIIYKAGVYCVFVFIVRVIELNLEGWLRGTSIAELLATFSGTASSRSRSGLSCCSLSLSGLASSPNCSASCGSCCSITVHRIWRLDGERGLRHWCNSVI